MPKIGMRIVKTSIAVFLCFMVNIYLIGGGMLFYSAITAVICLQTYAEETINVSKKRILGTVLGGIMGMLVLLLEQMIVSPGQLVLQYLLVSAAIVPLIYVSVLLRQASASAIACVVFISITVGPGGQADPLSYALMRCIETLVGILIAVGVNVIHPPKKYTGDTLFVTGLSAILLDATGSLSPRSKVELNRMISEGADISVATEMTPAAFLSNTQGVHWQLPIVAMNGAVLYDIEEKRYLDCCSLPNEYKDTLQTVFENGGVHYFANVLVQDVLLIYYGNFHNEGEEQMYESLRRSPHRNYIKRSVPTGGQVLYYLIVERAPVIEKLKEEIEALRFHSELFMLDKTDEGLSGYRYLKIYNSRATKGTMVKVLKELLKKSKVVAFGGNENDVSMLREADVSFAVRNAEPEAIKAAQYRLPSESPDAVVKMIRRFFQPFPWERKLKKFKLHNRENEDRK